ncbi:transmembrane protein 230-like isoform X2 [Pollicipes pollicipes]|nr:transmembrane protein 230-like [Pollicipes pollicipes]XP_037092443.1 transmembrane protein 230-like [Pollicipes pollicipes]XP_037092815.1 transmembrane protein 230-like isoform X2 [Pollicipes pollicipes]XP_037093167.1 transmembrane protein 230-like [Pollicipes pollicipes]XP_037093274.1 transmembrane protein 230-like isoform X2 [Pollicipes pollicipes]
MRRRNASGPAPEHAAQYHRLTAVGDGQFCDEQFQTVRKPIPWKSIFLASFLFAGGTTLLVMGSLLVSGFFDERYADRTWPLIVLGLIMFVPGAYHVRMAYLAYIGYDGYSFEDIPSFD